MRMHRCVLALVFTWLTALYSSRVRGDEGLTTVKRSYFSQCGGIVNGTRGYLHTPNFPNPFPVPIRCRWIIEAPVGKAISVYFTQYYLREGLRAAEYADFVDDTNYMAKKDFGVISFDNRTTYMTTMKPVLVLDLFVSEMNNVNMRVMDFFLDVYGFNITYEIMDKRAGPRRDACSIFHCSFNGNCYASAGFLKYSCRCLPGFYGQQCQFGPHCDPRRNVSLCKPGRQCRYVIGSQLYACDCPPGFEGDECESQVCKTINCSQLCVVKPKKGYQCSCYSGYKLSPDNKTCLPYARIRYVGSIKLKNLPFDPSTANKSSAQYIQLKKKIATELNSLLRKKVEEVRNLTVLNFVPGGVVEFHFFGNPHNSDVARKVLLESVNRGFIGEMQVFNDFIRFEREPALNLQEVYAKQGPFRVQGGDVSFACVAMGTSEMRFRWFKDGVPIDSAMSNHHLWIGEVPKNTRDQYTGILMIDKLLSQDSGTFTCEVSDWGETQQRGVSFHVISPPSANVTPLTMTLNESDTLTIMCQSEEDFDGSFGYSWLKDGQILNPSNGQEFVEELYPTGSRVKILKANMSAIYTCIVSNRAGQTIKHSHVTVVNLVLYPTCSAETLLNVSWRRTAVNSEDIHPCPANHRGYTQRVCSIADRTPFWEEPDFSNCVSPEMNVILRNFDKLKLGYMATNVSRILTNVLKIVQCRHGTMYPGEAKPILDLLDQAFSYELIYPPTSKKKQLRNLQVMMDIISHLLNSSGGINNFQRVVQVQKQVERQVHLLTSLIATNTWNGVEVRDSIVVEAVKINTDGVHSRTFPSNSTAESTSWLTDYLVVTADTKDLTSSSLQDSNSTLEIAVIFYRNFSSLLPKRYLVKSDDGLQLEYTVASHIVSLSAHKGDQLGIGVQNGSARITIAFSRKRGRANERTLTDLNSSGWNVSCGLANFVETFNSPQWKLSACSIEDGENFTFCSCNRFGTYAVLLTNYNLRREENGKFAFDVIIVICCIVSFASIFLTVLTLTIFWRKVQRGILMLKLQILFGVGGTVFSFLTGSCSSTEWYPFIATALHFFSLFPYSTQVCLELMVYLEITHSYQVQNARAKIILISWGIPILVTGATLAAQSQTGFKFVAWWVLIGDVYFYGFVITAVILNLLYVLLYLIVSAELRHVKFDKSAQGKEANHSGRVLKRSLVVQLFLVTLTVAAILHVNINESSTKYFFSASIVVCGVVVALFYGFVDNCCSCSRCKKSPKHTRDINELSIRSDSLRTFIKTDPSDDHLLDNNVDHGSICKKKRKDKISRKTKPHFHSRDLDDLLPDVTPNQPPHSNKIDRGVDDDDDRVKNQEEQKFDSSDNKNGDGHNVPLISYDGSPKKFLGDQSHVNKNGGVTALSLMSQCFEENKSKQLKPNPGRCYIRDAAQTANTNAVMSSLKKTNFDHEVPPPIPASANQPLRTKKQEHVTFGPVFSVPLDEDNYLGKSSPSKDIGRTNVA